MPGGTVTIDASASSQFVSALLLAGARYEHGVDVRHVGKPVPSLPHIAMSVAMLRTAGVDPAGGTPEQLARALSAEKAQVTDAAARAQLKAE